MISRTLMNKCKVTVVTCVLAMLITWMMASLIFYSPLFFSLCRQASLNEAAERQYERAAGLRPDVSTYILLITEAQMHARRVNV